MTDGDVDDAKSIDPGYYLDETSFFDVRNGVYVQTVKKGEYIAGIDPFGLTVNQKRIFDNKRIARIDFIPDNRVKYDKGKVINSITNGILGLKNLLNVLKQDKYPRPDYLVGATNTVMARFAIDRLGFVLADDYQLGDENSVIQNIIIIAKFEDFEILTRKIIERGLGEKLSVRKEKGIFNKDNDKKM